MPLLLFACFALVTNAFLTTHHVTRIQSPAFVVSHACLQQSSTNSQETTVSGEAESIFGKNCDQDGLMTKAALKELEFITELLDDGVLMLEELDQMWKMAAKFPGGPAEEQNRIDVDSFVQIYRNIDDLFEDDEEGVDAEAAALAEIEAANAGDDDDSNNDADRKELITIFQSISTSQRLNKEALSEWDEVQSLMEEGLLDDEEFDGIWDKIPKTEEGQLLDLVGFIKFNAALDDLFDFDNLDDSDDDEEEDADTPEASFEEVGRVQDADLGPAALFKALADADGLVGMPELKRWGELQDMIVDGDLMPLELDFFFDEIVKSDKQRNKLNKDGFLALYDKIDSLFEDVDEDEASEPQPTSSGTKGKLLATVTSLNQDEERLPCGLESTESEQNYIQELVSKLEAEPTNEVRLKQGAIEMTDLAGTWKLLYSSSSAMAYNKGLSGLGGSFPNGSFGGLKMKLVASKFLADVEYTERIKVVPDTASFDVTVNGSWELRSSVSIFTGEPSIVLTVVPDKVTYGPTSTRADHWKSLGPTNMLDVTYLDGDLRIMRGNTSTDSILIFKRT